MRITLRVYVGLAENFSVYFATFAIFCRLWKHSCISRNWLHSSFDVILVAQFRIILCTELYAFEERAICLYSFSASYRNSWSNFFFRWFVLLLVSSCLQSAPPRRPATSMALVNRQVSHPPAAAARHLTLRMVCRPNRVVVVVIIVLFGQGFIWLVWTLDSCITTPVHWALRWKHKSAKCQELQCMLGNWIVWKSTFSVNLRAFYI